MIVSYDVNKQDVHIATLTFTKSAYRLGETVLGVVQFNSAARVLKLSATLESHESLPSSTPFRKVHADHHSSAVLSTRRTTFSLDIPSDASPAFQISLDSNTGGLDWKVKLSLLVAIPTSTNVKHLVEDGPEGEWGVSYTATSGIEPQERIKTKKLGASRSWTSFFTTELDTDNYEWRSVPVETVEVEVPIQVWPGNTKFKSVDVVFDV